MSARSRLLESIAETIADYREGEVPKPTPEHVEKWVEQFDREVQKPILAELDHVLNKTYFSKEKVKDFLTTVVRGEKLAGDDPCSFWENVEFLRIQGGGNSQREMLAMFDAILEEEFGITTDDCGEKPVVFLYLDDAIFTGNRVRTDLVSWIESDAPDDAELKIVTIALHRGGQYYARTKIEESIAAVRKNIKVEWWRRFEIEDRKYNIYTSDVLRPTCIPEDADVQAYVSSMKYQPVLRKPGNIGEKRIFSSEEGRHLLEQEFLKAGVKIRSMCPNLNVYQRPLGNMVLETLGFGSLLVTFRNCPNNCPLAFWVDYPWYPLFPRSTNSDAFIKRLFGSFVQGKGKKAKG
ncbi:phosphoribosyltransferase-like protein [Desulfoferrobacter suflitae]|uniref:phosphoribosyltransferase-like protein n=1 Tax=Desulfoferrobacter suflitae TaxID=2865782 RepID=UPI002164873C|nr:hypothetical protein [Desulfoferrobacter suflitae]MCK8600138.1 hypothetical protein [Desulfoferrobacter suflitae]